MSNDVLINSGGPRRVPQQDDKLDIHRAIYSLVCHKNLTRPQKIAVGAILSGADPDTVIQLCQEIFASKADTGYMPAYFHRYPLGGLGAYEYPRDHIVVGVFLLFYMRKIRPEHFAGGAPDFFTPELQQFFERCGDLTESDGEFTASDSGSTDGGSTSEPADEVSEMARLYLAEGPTWNGEEIVIRAGELDCEPPEVPDDFWGAVPLGGEPPRQARAPIAAARR